LEDYSTEQNPEAGIPFRPPFPIGDMGMNFRDRKTRTDASEKT
jgi:hypothetical protein